MVSSRQRVRVDCQWVHSPFPSFFTPFFPFTRAEFMRPLRVCMQCQQCPANIFIQHREERGACQTTHTPPRRQTALPAHSSAEHTRKHLRHLTCLSISNTLASFFKVASNLNNEFSPSLLLLWTNLFIKGGSWSLVRCPEDLKQWSATCDTPTHRNTFR